MKDAIIGFAARILVAIFENLHSLGYNILAIVQGIDGNSQLSTVSTQVHGIVEGTLIPALQGVGYAIALLFFILALIDLVRSDRLTTEMWIKFFINLFVAVFFIYQSPNLYTAIIKFGDALGAACAEGFSNTEWDIPTSEQFAQMITYYSDLPRTDPSHQHWIATLLYCIVAGAPIYIITIVLQVVTYLIAFSRLIELATRGAFLPIGFALLSDDGFKGAGGRYFRKFVAICAQVAVLILVAGITTLIIGKVGDSIVSKMFSETPPTFLEMIGKIVIVVGAAIACVSVMFKSIGIVNDAFGA